jgi:hypothetical protein
MLLLLRLCCRFQLFSLENFQSTHCVKRAPVDCTISVASFYTSVLTQPVTQAVIHFRSLLSARPHPIRMARAVPIASALDNPIADTLPHASLHFGPWRREQVFISSYHLHVDHFAQISEYWQYYCHFCYHF